VDVALFILEMDSRLDSYLRGNFITYAEQYRLRNEVISLLGGKDILHGRQWLEVAADVSHGDGDQFV